MSYQRDVRTALELCKQAARQLNAAKNKTTPEQDILLEINLAISSLLAAKRIAKTHDLPPRPSQPKPLERY